MQYWTKRIFDEQEKLRGNSEKQLELQLKKYYQRALKQAMFYYESTFAKYLELKENNENITPNMLYTLDRWWQMQNELSELLYSLGDRSIKAMTDSFEREYKGSFNAIKIPNRAYNGIPAKEGARSAVKSIWCSDGKHFSQRIWTNTSMLLQELNEGIVNIAVTGKGTKELTKFLMDRFNVSYNRAKTIVVTEMTHVQTQAAKDRYEGYGVKEFEFLDTEDSKTCDLCSSLNGKRFKLSELKEGINAPSIHPNCRCVIIPVI